MSGRRALFGGAFVVLLSMLGLLAADRVHARETSLLLATDLSADVAAAASAGMPLLVLYSLPGCPHCESLRQQHLRALSVESPARALVRQVDLGGAHHLIDFAGRKNTHAGFARAQEIKFAPVVVIYGAAGARLVPPLVGVMLADFYSAYLDDALATASAAIKATPIGSARTKSI